MEKHSRHHSNHVIKVNMSQNRTNQCHVLPAVIYGGGTHHFCGIFGKNALPEYNHEETSDKFQLRDSLHNDRPIYLKKNPNSVMKDKERLRSCSRP